MTDSREDLPLDEPKSSNVTFEKIPSENEESCWFLEPPNRPFPSYIVPLFQNESVQNFAYENKFDLH